jgi:hypothetical protein
LLLLAQAVPSVIAAGAVVIAFRKAPAFRDDPSVSVSLRFRAHLRWLSAENASSSARVRS